MVPRRLLLSATSCLLLTCGDPGGIAGPPVPGALRYREIGAGYAHTCALGRNGSVYCWGANEVGALGDGTRTSRTAPGAIQGTHSFSAVDVGAAHTCALTTGGEAWCWGHNDEGQLGDGTFAARDRPVRVTGAPAFAAVSAGHAHSCGITAGGEAWCWGDDTQGQLGDGGPAEETKSAHPLQVQSNVAFTHIAAGYYQTCALTAAGAAYCWGLGTSGQNGDGSMETRHVPVRVGGEHDFDAIAAGDRFVCGEAAESVWCWGGIPASPVPVAVPSLPSLHALAAGLGASTIPGAAAYACGISAAAEPWCWGGAVRALRPSGTAVLPDAPRAAALAAGAEHVCMLDTRGYAWCGGGNYAGQLGDGTHVDRSVAVPVAAPAGS